MPVRALPTTTATSNPTLPPPGVVLMKNMSYTYPWYYQPVPPARLP